MDKSRKLRRYLKKDYRQLVDFPVEIVGRDGVVRRYTFEVYGAVQIEGWW